MAGIWSRTRFIWVIMYSCLAGVVASRAQWRFGIFTVGLQMAIKLNQVKSFICDGTRCSMFFLLSIP